MSEGTDIKATVKDRYARAIQQPGSGCCGGPGTQAMKGTLVKIAGYQDEDLAALPADAVENAFGCGNPVAFAEVREGDVVVDIGSGAGIDCLFAARKVGPTGKVIGIDMTPEMIERARENARAAGAANVEFRQGDAERMPVADSSVDWVISNCVINLSPDKPAVFREIARVLKPGGRISISDIVAEDLPPAVRASQDAWTSCLAGAISEAEYVRGLEAAGLSDVRVSERITYGGDKLEGLFGSSACCGAGGAVSSEDLRGAAGKVWSARFEGVKPVHAGGVGDVQIELARPADLPAIRSLLEAAGLPADVEPHLPHFLVARHGQALVGCIGMEVAGSDALFRSLVVEPAHRGRGLARRLYDALVDLAKAQGVERAYMLTTTIAPLAQAWGFRPLERGQVPAAIRASSEFRVACCGSAVTMARNITT